MTPAPSSNPRPRAAGKFLFAGDDKLWIKGVTYGTFRPDADGAGRQLVRIRAWLSIASPVWILVAGAASLALLAGADGAWITGAALSLIAVLLAAWALRDVATAAGAWHDAVRRVGAREN